MTAPGSELAIVTPTFTPDLERCELLVESVRRCSPRSEHYLVVDRVERAVFAHLEGPRTHLVVSEDLLPRGARRLPTRRTWWWNGFRPPARGWIAQQVLKLALASELDRELVVMCDSDVCLIRPFDHSSTQERGRTSLIDVEWASPDVARWNSVAASLLGLAQAPVPRNHVGNLVAWRGEILRELLDRLRVVGGSDWRTQLLAQLHFSEYTLYGVFVREVLGWEASCHTERTIERCHASWSWDLGSADGIDKFFGAVDAHHCAVMVHSKDGVAPARYRRHIEQLWA